MTKAFKIHAHSEDEVFDLHLWSEEHPDIDAIDADVRAKVRGFLDQLLETAGHAYPLIMPVPADIAPHLAALIADWGEMLAGHREPLFTSITEG